VFAIDSDTTFEGNFVLATLADQQSQVPRTQTKTATQKRWDGFIYNSRILDRTFSC